MSDEGGIQDNDKGLEKIKQEILALSKLSVKVGILENAGSVDGVDIAEYAAENEYGVPGPPYSENGDGVWFIPPRPFVRGYIDSNLEKIKNIKEMLTAQLIDGKIDAEAAIDKLGKNTKEGIKHFIKTPSNHTPNAKSTVRRKGTSRPLVDTGAMRDAVDYEVVRKAK